MRLDQKYQALLEQARLQNQPDLEGIQLCLQTLSLASRIDRDCASQLAPHALSEGRFVLLFLLDAAPEGVAPKVLAERAGIRRATVTGLLDGLQREDLIARHADLDDRRGLRIRLTPKGKQLAKTVFEQHSRWIASLFSPLSPQERTQLSTLLGKVAHHLSDENS